MHLLNHAIRKHYENENSIIQTSSNVKNNSFRLEFKFNQSLKKPDIKDVSQIESICAQLIKSSLNVYVANDVDLDYNNTVLNYPLRKLNDVLYPTIVRVVSIGTEWKNFTINKKPIMEIDSDFSAELCCGNLFIFICSSSFVS